MNRRTILTRFTPSLAVIALAAASFACSGEEGRRIDIVEGDRADGSMYMLPANLTIAPGEKVTFYIKNEGTGDHEFESDEAGIDEVVIPVGKTRKVTWTAPKSGEYPIYCDITGHRAAGMELTVRIAAP
jgi:uncharacterized cupredoxin-like copper-binding protein